MSKLTTSAPHAGVRLDAAIEQTLNSPAVDGVTRVSLTELRGALARGEREGGTETGEPGNLRSKLISFVMPRLRHPDVLQAEHHRSLLERLVASLSAAPADNVVGDAALELRRELRRLELLRQQRNSLVEG
jgi:hypothetical protein